MITIKEILNYLKRSQNKLVYETNLNNVEANNLELTTLSNGLYTLIIAGLLPSNLMLKFTNQKDISSKFVVSNISSKMTGAAEKIQQWNNVSEPLENPGIPISAYSNITEYQITKIELEIKSDRVIAEGIHTQFSKTAISQNQIMSILNLNTNAENKLALYTNVTANTIKNTNVRIYKI